MYFKYSYKQMHRKMKQNANNAATVKNETSLKTCNEALTGFQRFRGFFLSNYLRKSIFAQQNN